MSQGMDKEHKACPEPAFIFSNALYHDSYKYGGQ